MPDLYEISWWQALWQLTKKKKVTHNSVTTTASYFPDNIHKEKNFSNSWYEYTASVV